MDEFDIFRKKPATPPKTKNDEINSEMSIFSQDVVKDSIEVKTDDVSNECPLILVIDDDHDVLDALGIILEGKQYGVILCDTGEKGIQSVNDKVSVVILDVKMDGKDGFQTFIEITQKFSHLPIIFHSAYQDLKNPFEIMNDFRPFGYVTKEGDAKKLLDTLNSAVEYYQQIRKNAIINVALAKSNKRLEKILEITRGISSQQDKFTVMLNISNAILQEIPLKLPAEIQISFQETVADGTVGHAHFQMPIEKNVEGIYQIKLNKVGEFVHYFSNEYCLLQEEELSSRAINGCILIDNILKIAGGPYENPSWVIHIKGVDDVYFTKENKEFIDTLSQFLVISLDDIQITMGLEKLVLKRTKELEKKTVKIQESLDIQNSLNKELSNSTQQLEQQYNKLNNIQEQLRTIDEIVMFINKETNFNIVLSRILGTLSKLIPSVQRSFCMLYDADQESWVVRKRFALGSKDFRKKIVGKEWEDLFFDNVGHYIGWASITKGENVIRWGLYVESALPKAVLTIPISLDDKLVAFFHFDNQDEEDAFDPKILKVLGNLSEHITSAFIRSRDHKVLQEQESQLRETFEKYKQSQSKLAHIGEMTGGIIHDFKNPVGVIQGFIQLIQIGAVDEEEMPLYLSKINDEATRVSDMIHELLDFARGTVTLTLEEQSLGMFMEDIVRFLRNYIDESIEIILDLQYMDNLKFDQGKLRRVIYNLATNARDAMPESGVIRIASEQKDSYVEIRLSDNGPGIPESIRDNLFDTFVTYGKKKGSGMGTAIVKTIVEEHGGKITFNTETGKGTMFIIQLPLEHG